MTLPLDFSNDADVFDGRQPVTVQLPEADEPLALVVLKRPITLRELELSNGLYLPGDVRWYFSATGLTQAPVVGTLITEVDGRTWSVIDVAGAVFGARYTCTARSVGEP
jgi:hypothetical protein